MVGSSGRGRWSREAKAIVSLCLLALVVFLISQFRLVIAPFVLAVIFSYVLMPLVGFLQARLRVPRGLVVLLTYVLVIGISALLPALVIPIVVDEVSGLNLDAGQVLLEIEAVFDRPIVLGNAQLNPADLIDQAAGAMQGIVEPMFSQTLNIAVEAVTSAAWVIFILVVSFYLVKDGDRLRAWLRQLPPEPYRQDFARLGEEIGAIWAAFFRGQITLALVVSVIISLMGLVVGLPYALAMGLLGGLLEFLPSLGHGVWLLLASVMIFALGSTWLPVPNWIAMLILIGLHLVFEQVDLNYLIPRIVGRRVHLHPLVVILGIVAGAALAGVLGILLAAPTISSARVIGRYIMANLFDQDPFARDAKAGPPA